MWVDFFLKVTQLTCDYWIVLCFGFFLFFFFEFWKREREHAMTSHRNLHTVIPITSTRWEYTSHYTFFFFNPRIVTLFSGRLKCLVLDKEFYWWKYFQSILNNCILIKLKKSEVNMGSQAKQRHCTHCFSWGSSGFSNNQNIPRYSKHPTTMVPSCSDHVRINTRHSHRQPSSLASHSWPHGATYITLNDPSVDTFPKSLTNSALTNGSTVRPKSLRCKTVEEVCRWEVCPRKEGWHVWDRESERGNGRWREWGKWESAGCRRESEPRWWIRLNLKSL